MSVTGDGRRWSVGASGWVARILSALALSLLLARLVPIDPAMPDGGLDPSWQWAVNEAVSRRLAFGTDIAFTAGPASALVTHLYHPHVYGMTVTLASVLALVCWGSLRIACGPARRLAAAIAALAVAGVYEREGLILVVPLFALIALAHCTREGSDRDRRMAMCMVAVSSAVCLAAKGSMLLVVSTAVLAGVLLLAVSQRRRDSLALAAAFVTAFAVIWLAYGQPLRSVFAYVRSVVDLATGYTDAMSLGVAWQEVTLVCVVVVLAAPWIVVLARLHDLNRVERWTIGVAACTVALTALKVGTVRADQHVYITFSALVAMAAVALSLASRTQRRGAVLGLGTLGGIIVAVFGLHTLVTALPAQQVQGVRAIIAAGDRLTGATPALADS